MQRVLREYFRDQELTLQSAGGQGNHATFRTRIGETEAFVRVEDGPERDDYLEVESRVLAEVRALGVPAPRALAVDASRTHVPFAWQVLDYVPHPDLNALHKDRNLDLPALAPAIGTAVATWQAITPTGFGPFDSEHLRRENELRGFYRSYEDYFLLNFEVHVAFLVTRSFLTKAEANELRNEIEQYRALLRLKHGCLVHKDLALWNILGSTTEIAAFIDWDDTISGDPMDDLSLLGCFHDGAVLAAALAGYARVRPLPSECRRRFWLHLLRNMIVKAVIRVGAGYFDRSDGFYLIGSGSSGADLKAFTHARLAAALRGLREDRPIESL